MALPTFQRNSCHSDESTAVMLIQTTRNQLIEKD
jgi:hypothetical protein